MGGNKWICGDSSYNIYDKDGNQLNGGGGGGSGGCLKLDADVNLYSDGTCAGCNLDGLLITVGEGGIAGFFVTVPEGPDGQWSEISDGPSGSWTEVTEPSTIWTEIPS